MTTSVPGGGARSPRVGDGIPRLLRRRRHPDDLAAGPAPRACAARSTCRCRPTRSTSSPRWCTAHARPGAAAAGRARRRGRAGACHPRRRPAAARSVEVDPARQCREATAAAGAVPSSRATIARESARRRQRDAHAPRRARRSAVRTRAMPRAPASAGQRGGVVGADDGAAVGRVGHPQADAQRTVGEEALAHHAGRVAGCRARGACPVRDRAPRHR